jgi:glycylpeptide N-tetradecanoyltransferase
MHKIRLRQEAAKRKLEKERNKMRKKREQEEQQKIKDANKITYPATLDEAKKHTYKFWNTQPVTPIGKFVGRNQPINETLGQNTSQNEVNLPQGYQWTTLNVCDNQDDLFKFQKFISENYIEDEESDFSINYSAEFFKWVFNLPGSNPTCLAIVAGDVIAATIVSSSQLVQVYREKLNGNEINFLCVHKELRGKRLVPLLIEEITRRSQLEGKTISTFSSKSYLFEPYATVNYYHRALNFGKLVETGYSRVPANSTEKFVKKQLALPKHVSDKYVKMELEHVDRAYYVYTKYMRRFTSHQVLDKEQFVYTFVGNPFVTAYVVLEDGEIIDFVSYYKLSYNVLKENEQGHEQIQIANLYYYSSNIETVYSLVHNMMVIAKKEGMDVVNALDTMENKSIFDDMKFSQGTGKLYYYNYNYDTAPMLTEQVCKFTF